jgi:pyruvate-formate lyase-activating enzyme
MELLFADSEGKMYDGPGYGLVGRLGDSFVEPGEEELIPLPDGAALTMIPERFPVALALETGEFVALRESPAIFPVGALLPQGYTRTLLPAFSGGKDKKPLPLLGYTLCGIKGGQIYVAARQTDEVGGKWHPDHYNTGELTKGIKKLKEKFKNNRIVAQLAWCSLEYGCFTAQNIFYRRWEAGLPVSPACNALCAGCISEQPSECCPAPQRRLDFVPEVKEVVELGLAHLIGAKEAIISFGQGCEGEPSLQDSLISQAIRAIRLETSRGTINMNTNGGFTKGIAQICQAGIDSLRVSLNSAGSDYYHAYYRPKNYAFTDVYHSLKLAREQGVFVSLNLLVFPGVNDREEELESLIKLVEETGIKMIQLRNLNIDPDRYLAMLPKAKGEVLGVPKFLRMLTEALPGVALGNYSKPILTKL